MRPDSPIACAAFLHKFTMTCCNCARSPNIARAPGASATNSSTLGGSDARRSDDVSLSNSVIKMREERASDLRPKVRMLSTRSRPRSAAFSISAMRRAALPPGST
jgi:hypothetical protein